LKYLGVKLTKDVEWPYPGNYKMIFWKESKIAKKNTEKYPLFMGQKMPWQTFCMCRFNQLWAKNAWGKICVYTKSTHFSLSLFPKQNNMTPAYIVISYDNSSRDDLKYWRICVGSPQAPHHFIYRTWIFPLFGICGRSDSFLEPVIQGYW
jgi:hypothetical protein